MKAPLRNLGLLMCVLIVGLAAWRHLAPPEPSATAPTASDAVPSSPGITAPARAAREAAASDPQALKLRLGLEQVRFQLATSYGRTAAQADFALAPGRVLQSLLDRRCRQLERHAEELTAAAEHLALATRSASGLCRHLLYTHLQERLSLPRDLTEARFFALLERVDAAYERLILRPGAPAADEQYLAAYRRFREARRDLVGASLDRRLFGLADDLLELPYHVGDLVAQLETAPGTRPANQIAAYRAALERIEREHQVPLASVIEPVELAKLELRLHEAGPALEAAEREAVIARYTGPEYARRYVEHQRATAERSERLAAFNRERDAALRQLAASGLDEGELRRRMPDIDRQLLEKYQLE